MIRPPTTLLDAVQYWATLKTRAARGSSAAPMDWPAELRAFAQAHDVAPEVIKCFLDFWWPILAKEGRLDLAQIMRELYDYRTVMQEVRRVYDHLTGGKFSKPNTAAEHIIAAVEENYADTSE